MLYAFSWYDSKSTVTLLDTDGNSKWQYSTLDGDNSKRNSLNYKKIDGTTDMIIATSGSNYINYNRIISSSSSPYSVDISRSKTFRDPTGSTFRRLNALYIIDLNNSVSLIYDSSTFSTDIATINF